MKQRETFETKWNLVPWKVYHWPAQNMSMCEFITISKQSSFNFVKHKVSKNQALK